MIPLKFKNKLPIDKLGASLTLQPVLSQIKKNIMAVRNRDKGKTTYPELMAKSYSEWSEMVYSPIFK